MSKTNIATNLLGRIMKQFPSTPYAWWVKEDKSEQGYSLLATRAKVVAVFTETDNTDYGKGTVKIKILAEAMDGAAKGQLRDFYISQIVMVEEP